MPVDEIIIASINCLDGIEEHFKTQMIAWVRSAAEKSKKERYRIQIQKPLP